MFLPIKDHHYCSKRNLFGFSHDGTKVGDDSSTIIYSFSILQHDALVSQREILVQNKLGKNSSNVTGERRF